MDETLDELYPLVFDSIAEGVFTVDRDFRITSFNREAERITKTPRADALGRKCYEVLRASVCERGCVLRRTLETGEPTRSVRVDVLDARMEVVPLAVSTAVLRDRDGRMIGGVEVFRDVTEVETLRRELSGRRVFADIVGASPAMEEIFRILPDIAESDASVLVEGPSGVGKELVAKALHDLSPRRDGPFVRVNCAALPDALLESELFGYVKGAFTDARRDKPGRFQVADRGTILLDEIGDVSTSFQVKLLRVLQDREVFPLGATAPVRVDVRVVAATNRDLGRLVEAGSFREDLLYRIRVVPIWIPPLRERREDIPPLVDHIVRRLAARTGKPIRTVSPAAMEALYDYPYPGNVRELENALERAFVLCHGTEVEPRHLPPEIVRGLRPPRLAPQPDPDRGAWRHSADGGGGGAESSPEADRLVAVLEAHRWNRTAAARALGIARSTLWRRMRALGLAEPSVQV